MIRVRRTALRLARRRRPSTRKRTKDGSIALGDVLRLKCDSLAFGGDGVARTADGHVVFCKGAAPGDVLDARVTRIRPNMLEASVASVVEPSPDRVEPACAFAAHCGGCKTPFLAYQAQAAEKDSQVRELFERAGVQAELRPIIAAEAGQTLRYRNTVQMTASTRRWMTLDSEGPADRDWALGFYPSTPRGGYQPAVVHVAGGDCLLQHPAAAQLSRDVAAAVRAAGIPLGDQAARVADQTGFLLSVMIRASPRGDELMLCFETFGDGNVELLRPVVDALLPRPELRSVLARPRHSPTATVLHGDATITTELLGHRFRLSDRSFFQPNVAQAAKLYTEVRRAVGEGRRLLLDLFCGTGSIAICMAGAGAAERVVGFEVVPEAVADARSNAALNGLSAAAVEFHELDLARLRSGGGAQALAAHGRPDAVVVNPPRPGLHKDLVRLLRELRPERLVYVSCNPATLVRDLALLAPEFRVDYAQAVDMLPQTGHVEVVACLTSSSSAES